MKTIAAAKFKEQCLALLDEVDQEGISLRIGENLSPSSFRLRPIRRR